jgi:hypothetical protein
VKHAGALDVLRLYIVGRKAKACRALPQYGPFPGSLVDQDIRSLVRAAFPDKDAGNIDAGRLKALPLNAPAKVVSNGPDVA